VGHIVDCHVGHIDLDATDQMLNSRPHRQKLLTEIRLFAWQGVGSLLSERFLP
jgi:hypothetical protein